MKTKLLIFLLFLIHLVVRAQTNLPTHQFIFYYLENSSSSVNVELLQKYLNKETSSTDLHHFIVVKNSFCTSIPDESQKGFTISQKDSIIDILQIHIENQQDIIKHNRLSLKEIRLSISNIFNEQIDCSIIENTIVSNRNYNFSFIIDTDDFSKYFYQKSKFFSLFNSIPFISLVNKNSTYEYVVTKEVFKNINYNNFKKYSNFSLINL